MICIEAYQAAGGSTIPRGLFALTAVLVFLFYSFLEYSFSLIVHGKAASFFPLLPTALLLLLLQKTDAPLFLSAAVASAVAARLFVNLVPHIEKVILYGVFLLDAAAIYLYFGRHVLQGTYASDKLLFVSLVTLTLASVQELLFEKPLLRSSEEAFPFFYFALLGILLVMLPMRQAPINWTPVAEAGGRIFHRAQDMVDSAAYHLSSLWGGSYSTGYNSLDVSGGKIERSGRTELILKTSQDPCFEYTDEETSEDMKVRRTLYLAGGSGVDKPKLISVDREYAALFSQLSDVKVEYAYLNTPDVIAPANALLIYDGSGASSPAYDKGPQNDTVHKNLLTKVKGFSAGFCISYDSIFMYNKKTGMIFQSGWICSDNIFIDRLPLPLRNRFSRTYSIRQSWHAFYLFLHVLFSRYSYRQHRLSVPYGS